MCPPSDQIFPFQNKYKNKCSSNRMEDVVKSQMMCQEIAYGKIKSKSGTLIECWLGLNPSLATPSEKVLLQVSWYTVVF